MLDSIAIIFPRLKYKSGDPPLGICYIAAYLKKHHPSLKINILDSTFDNSFQKIKKNIAKIRPQAVGIYVDSVMYSSARRLIKELRHKNQIIIAGGPQATVCPQSLIDIADIVVIGEAELSMSRIVENMPSGNLKDIPGISFKENGNVYATGGPKERIALDKLEIPQIELLDNIDNYFDLWHYLDPINPKYRGLNIIASRGCNYNCSYCQPTLKMLFGNTVRYKSPEYLVDELKHYIEKFSVNKFFFHDDTLPFEPVWIEQFCKLAKKNIPGIMWGCNSRIDTVDEELLKTMQEAGLRIIHYGIESGSQQILDRVYKKGIDINDAKRVIDMTRRSGIKPSGFFMIGAPDEKTSQIFKTIKLSLKLDLAEASFSITTPFKGTYLYETTIKDSRFELKNSFADFDYYSKVSLKSTNNTFVPVSLLQKSAVFLFYIHPLRWLYILRHFYSLRSIKKFLNKIARFF